MDFCSKLQLAHKDKVVSAIRLVTELGVTCSYSDGACFLTEILLKVFEV